MTTTPTLDALLAEIEARGAAIRETDSECPCYECRRVARLADGDVPRLVAALREALPYVSGEAITDPAYGGKRNIEKIASILRGEWP